MAAGKKTNLHSYWDGGIGAFPRTGPNFAPPPLSQIPAAAARARLGNPANNPNLKLNEPTNYDAWAEESFELAKSVGLQRTADWRDAKLRVITPGH